MRRVFSKTQESSLPVGGRGVHEAVGEIYADGQLFFAGQAFRQNVLDRAGVGPLHGGSLPPGPDSLDLAGHGRRDADGNGPPANIGVLAPVSGQSLPDDRISLFTQTKPAQHPVAENEGEGLRGVDGAVLPTYLKVLFATVGLDGQIPAVHGDGHLVDVVDEFHVDGTGAEEIVLTLEGVG